MHERRTVFVLGAGASYGFKLPLGSDLKKIISSDLNIRLDNQNGGLKTGSQELALAFRALEQNDSAFKFNDLLHVGREIAASMSTSESIDDYVERHQYDKMRVLCAKLAIASAIIKAERSSSLYFDEHLENNIDFDAIEGCWLGRFMARATRRLTAEELYNAFNKLFIINFNYDRCIEHFCFHWLRRMYNLTDQDAAKIANRLNIYHPYGSLGPLKYQNAEYYTGFGDQGRPETLISIATGLRTYSESVEESKDQNSMLANLSMAKQIVFLGFGFHQQNLDVMEIPHSELRSTIRFYASTKGIPQPSWEIYKNAVGHMMNVPNSEGVFAEKLDGNCEEFWHEYADVLSR